MSSASRPRSESSATAAPLAIRRSRAGGPPSRVTSCSVAAGRTASPSGAHDPRYPLVIDPGLSYSTYLGGNSSTPATKLPSTPRATPTSQARRLRRLPDDGRRVRHELQRRRRRLRDEAGRGWLGARLLDLPGRERERRRLRHRCRRRRQRLRHGAHWLGELPYYRRRLRHELITAVDDAFVTKSGRGWLRARLLDVPRRER